MRYTPEEDNLLYEFYPIEGSKICAEVLDRSTDSIRHRAKFLGIKYTGESGTLKKARAKYLKFLDNSEYSLIDEYTKTHDKLLHRHICGYEWRVRPNDILFGNSGCPSCATRGFKSSDPAITYLVHFEALNLYKVGVTSNLTKRFKSFTNKPSLVFYREFSAGRDALKLEKLWLQNIKQLLYNSNELINGNTETFYYE